MSVNDDYYRRHEVEALRLQAKNIGRVADALEKIAWALSPPIVTMTEPWTPFHKKTTGGPSA